MAPAEMPSLSLQLGVRLVPGPGVPMEVVLLAVGEVVGHDQLVYASRMNKVAVVFLKVAQCVYELVESGVVIQDVFVQVSPLVAPPTRATVSGVPRFIRNELLERELRRFGKFASGFVGCKDPKLKHVMSLRQQVFMILDSQHLDVCFRVKYGEGFYMVYTSAGQIKCFECGDVGHKCKLANRRRERWCTAGRCFGSHDGPGSWWWDACSGSNDRGPGSQLPTVGDKSVKAGTHWPNRWTSETFGETQTSSGTNLFGVFSCAESFWNHADVVWSD